MAASTIMAALAVVPLLPLVFLLLIQLSLRGLGWSLQLRSRDKRAAIISRIQRDKIATARDQETLLEAEDGWEKIEKAGTAENGQPLKDDWEGIVGFFHPFW